MFNHLSYSRFSTLLVFVSVLLLTGFSAKLTAAPILDQEYNPAVVNSGLGIGSRDRAQTFTVGLSGQLTGVELLMERFSNSIGDLTVEIRSTAGGVPGNSSGAVLATTTVSQSLMSLGTGSGSNATFVAADLTAAGLFVNAGDVLAIALSGNPSGEFGWFGGSDNGYAGGSTYWRFPGDPNNWSAFSLDREQGFRTFVDASEISEVPAPGAIGILGLGLMAVFATSRRRGISKNYQR